MEVLRYPHRSCDSFLFWGGFAFGPIDANLETRYENLPFQSVDSLFVEGKGPFRENMVKHFSADGEITYSPAQQEMLACPTAYYPDAVSIPTLGGSRRTANFGLADSNGYGIHLPSKNWNSRVRHYITARNPYGLWTIWMADATEPNKILTWVRYEMVAAQLTSTNKVALSVTTSSILVMQDVSANLHERSDFATLEKLLPGFPSTKATASTAYIYKLDEVEWLSLPALREYTTQVCLTLSLGETVLPEKHFGDLANEASLKMNANNVNMLEFLRDIKNPMNMVPKLRNFAKLKTLANNYLTVHYGILPTISDLKRIYEAVQQRKPHFDRSGNTLLQRAYRVSKTVDNVDFTLEQHVKLAVANEDSGLDKAISSIESVGMIPNCKNLWDLIPLSFAIDWFVDIGDLLARADGIHRLTRFNVRYTTLSLKRTAKVRFENEPGLPITGYISLRRYHRWTTIKVPLPPLSLQEPTTVSKHWLEAGALLAQRTK